MNRLTAFRSLILLFLALSLNAPSFAQYTVSTYAVGGAFGSFDGFGLTVDNSGNVYATGLYPVNNVGFQGHAVFEIRSVNTPSISAVAGDTNATPPFSPCTNTYNAFSFQIDGPRGLAHDNSENLYISEGGGSPGVLVLSNNFLSAVPGNTNCTNSSMATTVDNFGNVFFGTAGVVYKVSLQSGDTTPWQAYSWRTRRSWAAWEERSVNRRALPRT